MRKFLLISIFFIIVFVGCFIYTICNPKEYKINIILIAPDALTMKHLPINGYDKIETPVIDYLAKESVVFKNCFVFQPGTTVSFSNLFTGSWYVSPGLKKNEKTLSEYLRENGYYTVGFAGSYMLWKKVEAYGVDNEFYRGFDEYIQDVEEEYQGQPYRNNENITKDIINWLNKYKNREKPFFLFAHYMDPHSPHQPSYDAEIEKIDKELGKIIETLKKLNVYENTMIIFLSDHGESDGIPEANHNSPLGHGWDVYTEQIQIPLIIKFPRNKYIKTINYIVRNIDVMPTILDYLGIELEANIINGASLLPTVRNNMNMELVSYNYASSTRVSPEKIESIEFNEKGSVFQYIRGEYSQRRELYDLTLDKNEKNNLFKDIRYLDIGKKADYLLLDIKQKLDYSDRSQTLREEKLDNEKLKVLKSLGYIQNGAPSPLAPIRSGDFLISKELQLEKKAILKYYDIIRDFYWGFALHNRDDYYPLKIIGSDDTMFILANEDRKIFCYSIGDEFKYLGINNVKDIAADYNRNLLYYIQDNEIKKINYIDSNNLESNKCDINLNYEDNLQKIHIDNSSNIYILQKLKLTKFNRDMDKVMEFDLPDVGAKQIVTNSKESIYILFDNGKIMKLTKEEISIKKQFINMNFIKNPDETRIGSIAIDSKDRIWALLNSSYIFIFNDQGKKIDFFQYNTNEYDRTYPIYISLQNNKIYIIDSWEGILVYSLTWTD